ncbi:MAG: T9SS type A sorting domain-containing protein [Bacteroidales bacterium]|nr:T9SS type A sorting domain-containing protein [Bacteroidales bacterium]
MKTPLTKILIALLIVFSTPCFAQLSSTVSFNYDANGNRTSRQIEIGRSIGDTDRSEDTAYAPVDIFEKLSVTLYPNPTEGQFSITINQDEDNVILHAILTTTTGEIVYDKTIHNQTERFELTGHPSGIYLLELKAANESHIWKVIKR